MSCKMHQTMFFGMLSLFNLASAEEMPGVYIEKTAPPPSMQRSDAFDIAWMDSLPLEDRIRVSLRRNPVTAPYADAIMITNYDGMVVIEGRVRFVADRNQVQAVVQQTNGVYRVSNQLTLAPLPRRRAAPSQLLPRPDDY